MLSVNHNCHHYLLSLRHHKCYRWIVFSALIVVIVKSSIPWLGRRWPFWLGVHGGAMLEWPKLITQSSIPFKLYSPLWSWSFMHKSCGSSEYNFKQLDKWLIHFFQWRRWTIYVCGLSAQCACQDNPWHQCIDFRRTPCHPSTRWHPSG